MPVTALRAIPLALAAALALTACTDSGAPTAATPTTATPTAIPTEPATTTASPDTTASPTAVPPALDFTARTIDGGSFAGASLAGRPAVLWFWAAWCTRCRGVADSVAAVARDNAAQVNLVGVAGLGSGDDAMRRFAKDTGIEGFPNLADDDGTVWRRFGVTSQEHYVLLDSTGKVVHTGPLSQADLRRRVAELS
ncbi:redoxin domain-containing protein [Micromonospora sp. WMMA1363]|uniref:redoxin domain-containing protein n=1 Tax=Micromonospora sp. WMMA1363 TaxID=3053985 RepID=UPI00259D098A|nr:redoxin domain-containing protein [Micromonospora sp. WMMA1363]MDM4718107.1 redoxin domain-containing protein [Micromonospora sp. WMMA1363]